MATRKRPNFVGVWLTDAGAEQITDRASAEQTTKSEMIRRLLAYATRHMPKGWTP